MTFWMIPTWLWEFEKEAGWMASSDIKRVAASVKAKVSIVCPACGQAIEVNLEGLSNYKYNPEGDRDATPTQEKET